MNLKKNDCQQMETQMEMLVAAVSYFDVKILMLYNIQLGTTS